MSGYVRMTYGKAQARERTVRRAWSVELGSWVLWPHTYDARVVLTQEIKALSPNKVEVKVIASPQRRYLVWMGASIVSNLSNFNKMLVWKADYDEVGPGIVHTKCF